MSSPLIECIPNFSEARRPEVVAAIVAAITGVPEVSLLNHSSDNDHNRTVVTFAGPPAAVEEAAFRGIQKAAELIDLDRHTGTHPRIGATDVVPFVPLSGVEMAECVQIAKRLGERVGRELNIPVYLYEEAASRPERVNLENNRRGQYEGLKAEIESNPDRKPDYGPARLGPAGATVIGARHPLIAYNVYLTTGDVSIAKAVAKAIRHSSGGFRFVKGLGMLVEGRAQVSMNLTDFRQTPVQRVVEAIRREAARHGVSIHHSELIGLIPGEALMDAAAWYLQLDGFSPEQVLENRLYAARSGPSTGPGFLDSLAAGTAAPGGGSAAAYAGAMGAALVAMVARLTIGKKKYAEVEAQMTEILNQAERLRRDLTAAVDEDAAAFESILAAFKLPKETPAQQSARNAAIEAATLKAAQVPLATAGNAVKTLALAERCAALGNLNAISDAASAAAMCRAALTGAAYNVRINVNALAGKQAGEPLLVQIAALEEKAANLEADVRQSMQTRGGLSL
ncbi:MAG: glutamate formiminotransferase / formiminotetrahydrofolate cyclodeaminase [Anaerolineaceae bacterium]|nr:MAG: glutamate formiminotransferase / formiminotetrahydrofolate cyclodeaminase [Anaerolineaceae bacterium]